jgi:hypothetical protein
MKDRIDNPDPKALATEAEQQEIVNKMIKPLKGKSYQEIQLILSTLKHTIEKNIKL